MNIENPVSHFLAPSSFVYNNLYVCEIKGATLRVINISVQTAGPISVAINRGGTDYALLSEKTMAVGDTLLMEWRDGITLVQDDVLKVKNGGSAQATFVATIGEFLR